MTAFEAACETARVCETDVSNWQASLSLRLEKRSRGTRLVENVHSGPLRVQRPFYPEGKDVAHVYLLHPPGGLVSGDELNINVEIGQRAACLLTTPGAGRVYRARADKTLQIQRVTLKLDDDASFEWLPLETILFDGAHAELNTEVHLGPGARFVGWEVTSLGLPVNGIEFSTGNLKQSFRVYQSGIPKVIERFVVDPGIRNPYPLLAGTQNKPISGFFVAGPFEQLSDELYAAVRTIPQEGRSYVAGISKVGEFLVGRYLGECSEQGRNIFEYWWQLLRPELLNRTACAPRIWLT